MNNLTMKELFSIFKGKKVFITGDTGFKGSWLSFWLKELGADVAGYALPPQDGANSNFDLLKLNTTIKHTDGDIRDLEKLRTTMSNFKPEFVFHLAAQAIVRESYSDPKYTFDTNVGGSVNLLESIRACASVRTCVYITSDKCYKNKEWIWGYRESDELGGHDPYSASKAAAELVFSSYVDSFFGENKTLGISSVRAGNVIGGGDWSKDRIVPDCIRALKKDGVIALRNPSATRPWQHVLEPLSGYLTLATKLYASPKEFSGSWNFGPKVDTGRTVEELATRIIQEWGSGKIQKAAVGKQPHEANLLQLNCDKSHILLNWHPRWDFDRTAKETVVWYKNLENSKSVVETTKQQIKDYMGVNNND